MDLDLQSSELKLHIDVKKLMLCYKYTIFLFQIKKRADFIILSVFVE